LLKVALNTNNQSINQSSFYFGIVWSLWYIVFFSFYHYNKFCKEIRKTIGQILHLWQQTVMTW
jgi:cytochrome oxidase Cu insertion factor (SCO1/SenC/PrrC family)